MGTTKVVAIMAGGAGEIGTSVRRFSRGDVINARTCARARLRLLCAHLCTDLYVGSQLLSYELKF